MFLMCNQINGSLSNKLSYVTPIGHCVPMVTVVMLSTIVTQVSLASLLKV